MRQEKVMMIAVEGVGWVFENGFFQLRDVDGEVDVKLSVSRGK